MGRKAKWTLAGAGAVLLALLAFVAAGPYLAMNGIRNVVASGEYGELWRFVDFEQLRDSVREHAKACLNARYDKLGKTSTLDLAQLFY